MLTVNDFIKKFEHYSNAELIDIARDFEGYSEDAQKAFDIVIAKRGGMNLIRESVVLKQSAAREEQRIVNETTLFFQQNIEVDFVKNTATSDVLDKERVDNIIDRTYLKLTAEKNDQSISAKTVVFILLGAVVASIVGGAVMGYFAKDGKVLYILIGSVFCVNYGIVALISQKSFRNFGVLIATILSLAVSFYLSGWFYAFLGSAS